MLAWKNVFGNKRLAMMTVMLPTMMLLTVMTTITVFALALLRTLA